VLQKKPPVVQLSGLASGRSLVVNAIRGREDCDDAEGLSFVEDENIDPREVIEADLKPQPTDAA
jgi:hypothetical protein